MNEYLPQWLIDILGGPVESAGRPTINRSAGRQLEALENEDPLAARDRVLQQMEASKPPAALRDQKRISETDDRLARRQKTLERAARGELTDEEAPEESF